jgi:hypothetical protein
MSRRTRAAASTSPALRTSTHTMSSTITGRICPGSVPPVGDGDRDRRQSDLGPLSRQWWVGLLHWSDGPSVPAMRALAERALREILGLDPEALRYARMLQQRTIALAMIRQLRACPVRDLKGGRVAAPSKACRQWRRSCSPAPGVPRRAGRPRCVGLPGRLGELAQPFPGVAGRAHHVDLSHPLGERLDDRRVKLRTRRIRLRLLAPEPLGQRREISHAEHRITLAYYVGQITCNAKLFGLLYWHGTARR